MFKQLNEPLASGDAEENRRPFFIRDEAASVAAEFGGSLICGILPRIKHMRGTWLHRKLGDRLFSLEMWQPERATLRFGVRHRRLLSMMPLPFQMLAAALNCVSGSGEHSRRPLPALGLAIL